MLNTCVNHVFLSAINIMFCEKEKRRIMNTKIKKGCKKMKIATLSIFTVIILILIFVIFRTILGFVSSAIAERRELKDKGFFWGFCLGIVGIIIMRCCPKE